MSELTEGRRRTRLRALTTKAEFVHDQDVAVALDGGPVHRYALVTTEGSHESTYADNPNITMHETLEEMGHVASGECDEGWTPKKMVDLDTGDEISWRIDVIVQAPSAATGAC